MQERRERLAGRAPVRALERAVVEHAVDPPHLLVEKGDELRRYRVDYLADDGVYCLRCFRGGCFFHTRVGCPRTSRKATFNRILKS